MIRGTTPTHIFKLPFDTNLIKCCKIIYSQNNEKILEKETSDCALEAKEIIVKLSQEETFLFDCHYLVDIQVRILAKDGSAIASKIIKASVGTCLDNEVLK